MAPFRSICVYCGSSDQIHPDYRTAAAEMGAEIARAGIQLVYGAGKTGVMGAVADGALAAGGEVIGVVPENLNLPHLIHDHLSHLEVTPDIQSRKARMSHLAEAFIAMPGGYGTFDELFETLTWAQIGLHQKPVGLLNTRGYFDELMALIDKARREGFIYAEHRMLLVNDESPLPLLEKMTQYQYPDQMNRWLDR